MASNLILRFQEANQSYANLVLSIWIRLEKVPQFRQEWVRAAFRGTTASDQFLQRFRPGVPYRVPHLQNQPGNLGVDINAFLGESEA